MAISIILLITGLSSVYCARILGVFPIPSISHQVVFRALLKELNSRGHEVVIITSDPMNNASCKNYTEIVPDLYTYWRKRFNFVRMRENGVSPKDFLVEVIDAGQELCRLIFENSQVKRLIKEKEEFKFDLVVVEWLFTPCSYGFAYHFDAPLIGISSLGLLYSAFDAIGNPTHPIYFPEIFYPALTSPTFWEKLWRLTYFIWFRWFWKTSALEPQDKLARQYFGNSMPYLGELEKNVSVIFTNIQLNEQFVVPKVPALIELGKMHLREFKPLPQDLQEFFDEAPEGVIYFSLGTNVRSDTMSEDKRKVFMDVFSQLSGFRILWKFESDDLPGKPSNVKIGKWFPQQDVLAHPKVKAFIFQGGLQSTEEAMLSEVPMLGLPFFSDQDLNMQMVTKNNIGERLYFEEITRETLLKTLKKLIYDPKYKKNIKKLSKISKDVSQTPLEKAVWWTEYVIRHKGAKHLRSGTLDLSWYEYLMVDVLAFIFVLFILMLWVIYCITLKIIQQINQLRKVKSKLN